MDEHEKSEEQVEDLDTPESEAEEVKGGYSFGATQGGSFIKGELGASKIKNEFGGIKQNPEAWGTNHNETLIAI